MEDLDTFRARARSWIDANLPPEREADTDPRELQRTIFDGGYAGLPFPADYGGAGLTLEHHRIFHDIAGELGRLTPTHWSQFRVSVNMIGPTILDRASEPFKRRFLPPLLRGDEVWVQLLSEPRGGSDLAGVATRLSRDGTVFALSGSKMWTTNAHIGDFGLCLCRSNWDVPKHQGLSMIGVPLDAPGVTIEQTRVADGTAGEFCEEFFDDVVVPAEYLVGGEGDGWNVAQTLLLHERNAVANVGFGYTGPGVGRSSAGGTKSDIAELVRAAVSRGVHGAVRQQIAQVFVEERVLALTSERVNSGIELGTHLGPWGSLVKLGGAVETHERARVALAAMGAAGVIWDGDDVQFDNPGTNWLGVRGATLAGGSNEIQRNIISERLVGLPREPAGDRHIPYKEVVRNQGGTK